MANTMNYTFALPNGEMCKIANVPMNEAKAIQRELEISQKDAMLVWGHRNGQITDKQYEAMGVQIGTKPVEIKAKRKAPARKVDVDKKLIVTSVYEFLKSSNFAGVMEREVDAVVIENDQRLIRFQIGEDTYDLTLARKRKPKN